MKERKIEELIAYLAGKAFKDERLEAEIRKNINQGLPHFAVRYKRNYGKEQMLYELRFRKDHQFDAYRMEGYKARYRKAVEIGHQIINGVDTAELEERMKDIDWYAHFEKQDKIHSDIKEAQIISDLLELDNNHNKEGIKIQELLQFKYFPEQYFDERLKELQSQYDKSREFISTENGLCNAHLAYHIVSGRLDDLYARLQPLALDQYPGMDVYIKLETILSDNPEAFELKCFRNEPEGYTEYIVPVTKMDQNYFTDTFTVSLTPYPPFEHGVYNGIDTGELEAMMREINWHNDRELFIFREDREPEFLPKVALIQEQMYRLSLDLVGSDIADKLQLKYWTDASFFEGIIQQTAWDYLETLPKRVQQFPVEISAKTAFNLLNGRAAMHTSRLSPSEKTAPWIRLDFSHKDENNNYPVKSIKGFIIDDLENRLDLLPIDNISYYSNRNALLQGDLLVVPIKDGREVILRANPEQKTIDVYTKDMRPIPVNLRLDPDWKPALIQKENVPEKHQKVPSKSKPKSTHNIFSKQSKKRRRKGRGI